MFNKRSRYYPLPDVVTEDQVGQAQQAKSLRLIPEVTGDFEHIVEDSDRLDHLAHKYYQRSRHWWRICDANPAFLSPLEMVGHEPIHKVCFHLLWNDKPDSAESMVPPPWVAVRQALKSQPGVLDVQINDEVQLLFRTNEVEGEQISIADSKPDRSMLVTMNMFLTDAVSLMNLIMTFGFVQVRAEEQTRIGKPITIPPANGRNR